MPHYILGTSIYPQIVMVNLLWHLIIFKEGLVFVRVIQAICKQSWECATIPKIEGFLTSLRIL